MTTGAGAYLTPAQQRKVKALGAQLKALRQEQLAIEEPAQDKYARSLVGACFRYSNTFGEKPKKKWYGYVRVTKAEDGALTCLRFEHQPNGYHVIETQAFYLPGSVDGYERISHDAFWRAWAELLASLAWLSSRRPDSGPPRP